MEEVPFQQSFGEAEKMISYGIRKKGLFGEQDYEIDERLISWLSIA